MHLHPMRMKIIYFVFITLTSSALSLDFPIVDKHTGPTKMDNGILFITRTQDFQGHLSFTYRLPNTEAVLIKYCGSLKNYIEVVKMFVIGEIHDILAKKNAYDIEIDLLVNYSKSWHYLYYDRNGKFVGKVTIDESMLK